ncbi:hypothetical protein P9112_000553 [Eukaryota sp. TZLM1-RC]
MSLQAAKTPDASLAVVNKVWLHPNDVETIFGNVPKPILALTGPASTKPLYTFAGSSASMQEGSVGLNDVQRKYLGTPLGQSLSYSKHDVSDFGPLDTITFTIDKLKKNSSSSIDASSLADYFRRQFLYHPFYLNHSMTIFFNNSYYVCSVTNLQKANVEQLLSQNPSSSQSKSTSSNEKVIGILVKGTSLLFEAGSSGMTIKGQSDQNQSKNLLSDGFDPVKFGIGGLSSQFLQIFQRALVRRMLPPEVLTKLNLPHIKGILLYGPPGTGKTLTARNLARVLNCREPIVKSAPEILNKYVGESEKNVREMFSAAEEEYKEHGEDSELHVIIIDELEAICKERGSTNDGTGVGDNVINQLLAKMDGVDELNNILIIGMTNRKDLIDKALLRPGRFELHIEVGLPSSTGRSEIIQIHTQSLVDNNLLDTTSEDFASLLNHFVNLSQNYTGAELAGVVRAACDIALSKHADMKTGEVKDLDKLKVSKEDFEVAFNMVKPQFGRDESTSNALAPNGCCSFPEFDLVYSELKSFIDSFNDGSSPITTLLLEGDRFTGKTAIAGKLADYSKIPFIKYLSISDLDHYSDARKSQAIATAFLDAYKSPYSVVILDDVEDLMGYIRVGEVFSRDIFTRIRTCIRKEPPMGHRVLVIATTSEPVLLRRLGLIFDEVAQIPLICSKESARCVLKESGFVEKFRNDGDDGYFTDLEKFFGEFPLPVSNLFSDRLKNKKMDNE